MMRMAILEKQGEQLNENLSYISQHIAELEEFHNGLKIISATKERIRIFLNDVFNLFL